MEVGSRDRGRVMLVASVLSVGSVLTAGRRRLERTRGQADDGGRVERGRRGVHVLVSSHLFPEASPAVAEPHLNSGLGQFGPKNTKKNFFLNSLNFIQTLYVLSRDSK